MKITRDLLMGLRSHANTEGVTATIVAGGDLPSTPDRAIALNVYDSDDLLEVARADVRVQFMIRGAAGDTLSPADLSDELFDIFHGVEGLWIGSLHVALGYRVSAGVSVTTDTNKRTTRTDNYAFLVDVPTTARRPV